MNSPTTQEFQAYRLLGITEAELRDLSKLAFREAESLLQRLKMRAKKNYKRLAFELHPDRNGGDLEKTELYCLVTRVQQAFEKMESRPPVYEVHTVAIKSSVKPPMQVNMRRVNKARNGLSSASSREIAARLARMRPGS